MTFMYGFIFGLLLISLLVHIEKWLDEQDRLEQEDFEMWDTGKQMPLAVGEVGQIAGSNPRLIAITAIAATLIVSYREGGHRGVAVKMVTTPPKPEPKVSTLELTPVPVLEVWPVATPTTTPPGKRNAGNRPSTFVRSQKKVRQLEGGNLAAIRNCESGGNYGAISASGKYKGAYQFDAKTHRSVGGDGNAADDSPAEQDAAAARLYAKRGRSPWPNC